jgi:hypothetical protein
VCESWKALFEFKKTKRAMVAATYTQPKGIFYGGKELSKSHQLLKQWLIDSVEFFDM